MFAATQFIPISTDCLSVRRPFNSKIQNVDSGESVPVFRALGTAGGFSQN